MKWALFLLLLYPSLITSYPQTPRETIHDYPRPFVPVTPETLNSFLVPACLSLFPEKYNTPEARAMLIAIALQESDLEHRQQLIGNHRNWWESLNGPATSYWQFEKIGIRGVLEHRKTGPLAREVLEKLGYPEDVNTIHKAIAHNDILAVCIARLALYRLPQPLPQRDQSEMGWNQYVEAWRPGKPKRERWAERFELAWQVVGGA
jgi:hypothetical protein